MTTFQPTSDHPAKNPTDALSGRHSDGPVETRSIFRLLIVGAIALFFPVFVYLVARLSGTLGADAIGTWRNTWQGMTLYLPFLAALITFVTGSRHLFRSHYTRAIRCLGLAVVQIGLAFTLYALLGWTVR